MVTSHKHPAVRYGAWLLAGMLFYGASLAAQMGSIAGTVIDATTKQPMGGVHISMFLMHTTPLTIENAGDMKPVVYGAMSRPDGRFSISGLPSATWLLQPMRTGYVFDKASKLGSGGSVFIRAGEAKTDVVVAMTPRAVITGRVTDPLGDPIQNARVEAVSAKSGGFGSLSADTDDQGVFYLHGAPGKYFVSAQPLENLRFGNIAREVRTDGSEAAAYVTTWYPATESKGRATAIEALPGRDVTGVEIRLISHRSVTVSGTVTGLPAGKERAIVHLWPASGDSPQLPRNMVGSQAAPDGQFTFNNLPSGDYRLQATLFRSGATGFPGVATGSRSEAVDLHVESGERTGIRLTLLPSDEVSGTVEIPGPPDGIKRAITLQPFPAEQALVQRATGPIDGNGSFHLNNIFPARYELRISPLPENAFIQSVQFANASYTGSVLDLRRGIASEKLRISINLNGGSIGGSVVDDKDDPVQSPTCLVVLAQNPNELNSPKRIGPGKLFNFTGLAPGTYRIYAFDPLSQEGDLDSVEFRTTLFNKAKPIEIHEGDRLTRNVRLLDDK